VDQMAPNVVGILEGSDPALRDQYVVFSAHMDHVGTGPADAQGDTIYNGADDNASGTSSVIEIAEAAAALSVRPRRSMMFVLVSGEEKGLWGSGYFAEHPPVPLDRLVADLNIDMVGRNWPDTIVVIGREHSNMGATLSRVSAAHGELGMTAIDDLWPNEQFFFRSDHYNFARNGVPALFFFNGVHRDYHAPGDSPDKINAEKASRIARLVFYLGMEIANADERPVWNPESYRRIVQGRGSR
jgi:Zn-dependent M28 family amino/carboxypeptidase